MGLWGPQKVNVVNGLAGTTLQHALDGKGGVTTNALLAHTINWAYGVITGAAFNTASSSRVITITSADGTRDIGSFVIGVGVHPHFLELCIPVYEPWAVKSSGTGTSMGLTYEMLETTS